MIEKSKKDHTLPIDPFGPLDTVCREKGSNAESQYWVRLLAKILQMARLRAGSQGLSDKLRKVRSEGHEGTAHLR